MKHLEGNHEVRRGDLSYDATINRAKLDPEANLARGIRNLLGNALGQDKTTAGNQA